ncbi:MAG: NUDIX domain-containing protein [Saprospiraceae bacterium]|nr:NUDIX domain-containing protein [Saprospiraceae bacterium]
MIKKKQQLNPYISVDCVIFGFDSDRLKVLLIEREDHSLNTESTLALPGDLINNEENLNESANRVLKELTGLKNIYLKQIGAFGDLNRISKKDDKAWLQTVRTNPEARVITIAYYSLVKISDSNPKASSFATSAKWYNVEEIKALAFDHYDILRAALSQLRNEIIHQPVGFNLMPKMFTLGQLQKMYEAILNKKLDKRNFRRKILKLNILDATQEKETGVSHKPAQYFVFNKKNYNSLADTGFNNFGF